MRPSDQARSRSDNTAGASLNELLPSLIGANPVDVLLRDGLPVLSTTGYAFIPLEITVNRSAADTWKRIGKFCDIGEWLQIPCTITSGKDGEFGAVRSVAGEVLVGKTELSYTYTQTVRNDRPYNLYHGTLETRPLTETTSKIVYTIFFDNSMLADDAARRTRSVARRRSRRRCRT